MFAKSGLSCEFRVLKNIKQLFCRSMLVFRLNLDSHDSHKQRLKCIIWQAKHFGLYLKEWRGFVFVCWEFDIFKQKYDRFCSSRLVLSPIKDSFLNWQIQKILLEFKNLWWKNVYGYPVYFSSFDIKSRFENLKCKNF